MSIDLKIKPICHICYTPISQSPFLLNIHESQGLQLDCRNTSCPLHIVADRCRVTYYPKISTYFYSSCNFWIPQDNAWYQMQIVYNLSVKVDKTKVAPSFDGKFYTKPQTAGGTRTILDMLTGFQVSIDDNLAEKVPKLLNKAKVYVTFS